MTGNTDVWSVELDTNRKRRLTTHPGIDTSPGFSPDGGSIVFVSDRGGKPNLYIMEADGANPRRISFGQGSYTTPVWSPRGDLIAFTKTSRGEFAIGVMRVDGSGERLLERAFHVEGPTWSPNGRVVIFFKESEIKGQFRSQLVSIDLTGLNRVVIDTPTDASDPAWSPLRP